MEIPEIKACLPLEAVLTHYGLAPDKNSRLLCPFHPDRVPSLQLYPRTGTWCCFSTNCSAGTGDVIDLIRLMEKCTEHGAIEKAKALAGGGAEPSTKETAILPRLFGYFRNAVANSAPAKEYCASRGLDYSRLEIGYNSGQFHHGARKDEGLIKECLEAGLLLDRGQTNSRTGEKAYSAFGKHCLAFPLRNRQNQITGLYFRSTVNESDQKHYYLKNRKGLYPHYPEPETKKLILTEAIIDAASLLINEEVAGSYGVLALYGTNGLTAEHLAAIKGLKQLEEVIFFFDGDAAGKEAAAKYGQLLQTELPNIKVSAVDAPEGEDVNSLLQSHEPEVLAHLIKERSPFLFSTEKATGENTGTESTADESPASASGKLTTLNPELLLYADGPLEFAVLGGVRLTGLDRLRVTLKVTHLASPRLLPVRHSLDLYHAGQTEALVSKLGEQLEVPQAAEAVERLTQALERYRHARMEALKPQKPEAYQLTEKEKAAALAYLKAPQLLERTGADIGRSGLVGEEVNRLVAYLVYTSRKRESPLQLMCLGASGTGKTYLQEKVGELMPEEEKVEITALSENAFYYFGKEELKHKLLLIEDLDGAQDALYPLRELQSKRRISKTVTLKDSKGNLKTVTLQVEGPVCVSGCTTRERLYEDNANRCLLLDIDTTAEQDTRIMAYQRGVSAGLTNKAEERETKQLLQNVQRLLKPVAVRNPHAPLIDLPGQVFKPRRTITLLLSFIETVTFYHQHQCPVRTDAATGERYIETTAEHVQWAFKLLREILFRKSDELSFATRRFLESLKGYLKESGQPSFQAREVRQRFRLPPSSVKRYLWELERYGYLKAKGNRYKGLDYQVTDGGEYQQLRDGVDQHLEAILRKISGPVAR